MLSQRLLLQGEGVRFVREAGSTSSGLPMDLSDGGAPAP